MRALGFESIECLCPDGPYLAARAIADNMERGLNEAELARAFALSQGQDDPKEREAARAALGLSAADKRLPALEAALGLPPEGLEALAAGRLDLGDCPPLAALPDSWRGGALTLLLTAKASRRNRRRWLEWLGDLAAGDSALDPLILAAAAGPEGEREAGARLFERRFPGLARLRAKRRALLRSLKLPDGLRLELDPEFEDLTGELRLSFHDQEDLQRLVRAASELADRDEIRDLWGEDEGWPPA
jgi:hypothetical protein